MQYKKIDSSLLSVFRLFVGMRLLFSIATLAANHFLAARVLRLQPASFYAVAETSLLLIYLSWPAVQRRLGSAYLPLALVVATVGPIVENFLTLGTGVTEEIGQVRALGGQWQVIILLIVPVILLAWKYSFRFVVGYLIGLAGLDILLFLAAGMLPSLHTGLILGVIVFRTLALMLVGFVVNRLATEQRSQNEQLAKANQQLASSANTLEQLTISRERNRMARELHDTLAHSLSAVAVQLEAASALWANDPKQAHEMLDRSLSLTRNGLNEARRAIQALRVAPLDDLGLNLALRNLAVSEAERGGYQLDLDLPEEMPRLQPEAEHGLFRIAEEALRNIAWHANAQKVQVKLAYNSGRLEMSIRDNGCGFKDEPWLLAEHFGLRGMHERAEGLGGKLAVHSQPDKGTEVRLEMDVDHGQGLNLR